MWRIAASAKRPSTLGEAEKGGFISTTLGRIAGSRWSWICSALCRVTATSRNRRPSSPARVSAISFRASRALASSAKIASNPVPADGSSTTSAGVSAAASAATKPSANGVENCWKCSDSSERRVCDASRSGEAGQHLEHRRGRARARAHRAAEFAQEQDLGRFERLVGVLPHPRPFGIGAAEGGLHRRAQSAAVEGTALPQQLREQRRGMKKPRDLVGRGLRQEQRERGRGGCEAEHAGDLRERGSDEARPGALSSPSGFTRFRLSFSSRPRDSERCRIKKARAAAGQGSEVFSYWPMLRSIGVTGAAAVCRPCFRSPDPADQRARPAGLCYGRARSCVPKMRVRVPKPR